MHSSSTSALCLPLLFAASLASLTAAEPVYDSNGIPYALIEKEPKIGRVQMYQPDYQILICSLQQAKDITPGLRIAVRRNGVIVAFGYIEQFDSNHLATINLIRHSPGGPAITQPARGDDVIRIPKPYYLVED